MGEEGVDPLQEVGRIRCFGETVAFFRIDDKSCGLAGLCIAS